MNGVQTRFKCKLDVKRCKRFVFPPSSLLPRSNALKTKAIRYFQTDRTLTRIVSPPLYYAHKNTGRPLAQGKWFEKFRSNYLDVDNEPLYPFGYGLSYTTFSYGDIDLSRSTIDMTGELTAAVMVTNTGTWPGSEVVQLYIRDLVGSTTRPVKELKGFQKIFLEPGQSEIVRFKIAPEMLRYYNYDLQLVAEPGEFEVMIGTNSRDVKSARFTLK